MAFTWANLFKFANKSIAYVALFALSVPSFATTNGLVAPTRSVIHTQAYLKHPEYGEHINIKVTPPEKRGKDTYVLVEIYNFTKSNISVMSFDVVLQNRGYQNVNAKIDIDDLNAGWSAPRWVKIPGDGKIPIVDGVTINNVSMYDPKTKELKFKVYSDLIKR